jgi:septal ring factor EnvC (AmiA/AmiB activator)
MRLAGVLLLLALAGCNDMPQARTKSEISDIAADEAEDQVAPLRAQIAEMQDKIDELERALQEQKTTLQLTGDSLTEARGNHDALLKTFNQNVDKSNARERGQEQDIDWIMRRLGVPRPN